MPFRKKPIYRRRLAVRPRRRRRLVPRRTYRKRYFRRPRTEYKNVDTTSTVTLGALNNAASGYTTLGTSAGLGIVAQGLTDSTRVGNHTKLASVNLMFQLTAQTNTKDDLRVRVQLVRWNKYQNGLTLSTYITQFYETDPTYSQINMGSMRAPDYLRDFSIISTRLYYFPRQTVASQGLTKLCRFFYKFRARQGAMTYKGTASTDLSNGHYFIIITTDGGDCGTAATGLSLTYKLRTWYTDM